MLCTLGEKALRPAVRSICDTLPDQALHRSPLTSLIFFSDRGKYCIRCFPADLLQHMHTVQVPTPTRTFVGLGTDSACTGSSIGSIN